MKNYRILRAVLSIAIFIALIIIVIVVVVGGLKAVVANNSPTTIALTVLGFLMMGVVVSVGTSIIKAINDRSYYVAYELNSEKYSAYTSIDMDTRSGLESFIHDICNIHQEEYDQKSIEKVVVLFWKKMETAWPASDIDKKIVVLSEDRSHYPFDIRTT